MEVDISFFLKQESFLHYVLGDDEAAVAYWQAYLEQHPQQASIMAEARLFLLDTVNMMQAEKKKPAALHAMRLYLQQADAVKPKTTAPVRKLWMHWVAAASILALMLLAIGRYLPATQQSKSAEKATAAPVFYYTTDHNRHGVSLSDGSYVLLDKDATLTIDSSFGLRERRVQLTGTAWFKVAKNKEHPFRVITGNYVTTALGTAFRIQQHENDRSLKIELEEGKLAIHQKTAAGFRQIAVLLPQQSVFIQNNIPGNIPANTQVKRDSFSVGKLKTWRAEELVFDNAPVFEVIDGLKNIYNIQIIIQDKNMLGETFTGNFRQDAIEDILEMLCFSLNKHYKIQGDTAIIY